MLNDLLGKSEEDEYFAHVIKHLNEYPEKIGVHEYSFPRSGIVVGASKKVFSSIAFLLRRGESESQEIKGYRGFIANGVTSSDDIFSVREKLAVVPIIICEGESGSPPVHHVWEGYDLGFANLVVVYDKSTGVIECFILRLCGDGQTDEEITSLKFRKRSKRSKPEPFSAL